MWTRITPNTDTFVYMHWERQPNNTYRPKNLKDISILYLHNLNYF